MVFFISVRILMKLQGKNLFTLKISLIHERHRERQKHRQREKQAPQGEPNVRLDPRTPGSWPEPKAGAQPLSHPSVPVSEIVFNNSSVACNIQCSSHHVPSLMPITYLPQPPTSPPATLSLFPIKRLMICFPVFILFSFPFSYVHLFCFLSSKYEWNTVFFPDSFHLVLYPLIPSTS